MREVSKMNNLKTCLAALLLLGSAASASGQDILVKNAKIITNTASGIIESSDILIQDGKVANIAANISAPAGTEIMDGGETWVTPGLFAPFSTVGLVEVSLEQRTNDSRAAEAKTSVSNLAADSFNPKTPIIGNTRLEGITHIASTASASGNIFGGIGLIANTSGEFDSIESETAFVYVQLGEGGAETAGGSRAAAMGQLRAALNDAGAYPSRFNGPEDGDALLRRDAAALYKAARGQMPMVISADRASDLLGVIKLKKEFGLDVIILGAAEGWMVADELKAAGIKVMVDPQENLPGSFDMVGARLDNALLLDAAGVDYAFTTRSADVSHNIRVLSQHAGNAVGAGLTWDKAFAAVSSTPARWFKIPTGTIERGGAASLVVWDGDPLEVTSGALAIYINGEPQEMSSRQSKLRDRYNPLTTSELPHKYR